MDQITKVLASDAALSAKLLRVVNSAVYGSRQEIRTVRHAISLLGLISVRTLALSFSLAQGLRKGQQSAFQNYWKRSSLAAVSAKQIALALGLPNAEEAFLAALLQDIGVLALAQIAAKKFINPSSATIDDHSACISYERAEF